MFTNYSFHFFQAHSKNFIQKFIDSLNEENLDEVFIKV